jgi:hypothetical protein
MMQVTEANQKWRRPRVLRHSVVMLLGHRGYQSHKKSGSWV